MPPPTFRYKGRDKFGALKEGHMEGGSVDAVASKLTSSGITPIHIELSKDHFAFSSTLGKTIIPARVKIKDLIIFSRQMYAAIKAGIPIIQSISQLAETTHNKTLAETLRAIVESIESGLTLASAMQKHPRVFPVMVINTIHVGEGSGQLDEAFLQVFEYLVIEEKTRGQLKAALRYPLTVIVAMAAAIVIINIFVIPKFALLYRTFHATLPLPTRILIATSNFFVNYWPHMLIGLIAATFATAWYIRTKPGRLLWDGLKLKIPVVGSIIKRLLLARFARSFVVVIRTGLPLIDGIELAAASVGNAYLHLHISKMRTKIAHGESMTSAALSTKLFPPLVIQMIAVGEETGHIDTMLEDVAEFYERDVEYEITRLADAMQPILLIGMGGLVLILALGVFLPMWNLAQFAR